MEWYNSTHTVNPMRGVCAECEQPVAMVNCDAALASHARLSPCGHEAAIRFEAVA